MAKNIVLGRRKSSGFSLVELMIVVVIVAILASIAIPAYNSQIRQSRRTDAKTALLDLAGREERFFSSNNGYTNSQASLGYAPATSTATFPPTSPGVPVGGSSGATYYAVTMTLVPAAPTATPPTPAGYSITATPTGTQAADTQCASFTLTSTGAQTATSPTDATASVDCWK